jgi:lysophospholipase L1-like esterase
MEYTKNASRRNFLKQASVLGATVMAIPAGLELFSSCQNPKRKDMDYTFLFQGDSITDGNRSRNPDWNHVLGHGYAYLIAARLWFDFPTKGFHFLNRGVSGDQVTDLKQRWPEDSIELQPNLISILVGVNDTMNAVFGNKNATITSYENDYRALLKKTREQLPGVELVICEPFILPVGRVKENWEAFQHEMSGRQEAAKNLAKEFNTIWVPLQDRFNEVAKKYPPDDYWLWDGVHPMPNGHELIAREWIKEVGKKLKFI